jgi:proteasome accessory factor B
MRRIERLINLIAALLETSRPLTAEDIREQIAGYDQANFESFRRSFERDKEDLRAMGIPLQTVSDETDPFSDVHDSYIIPKDEYYLPQLDLEPDELAALRVAGDAVLGAGEETAAGLMKLTMDDAGPSWAGPRIMWGADVAAEQPFLGPLYASLVERRTVAFDYEPPSGETTQREVEAYGLVHRRGNWYLVGRDTGKDAIRAFKLSRIKGTIRRSDDRYAIPEGFDAGAHIAGEPYEVGPNASVSATVRFTPSMRWWVDQNMPDVKSAPLDDGGVELEIPVANLDALVSWVIGFGPTASIVAPPEARAALLEHLTPFLERSS